MKPKPQKKKKKMVEKEVVTLSTVDVKDVLVGGDFTLENQVWIKTHHNPTVAENVTGHTRFFPRKCQVTLE